MSPLLNVFNVIPLKIPLLRTNPSLPFGIFSAASPIGLSEPTECTLRANITLGKLFDVPVIAITLPLSI